MGERNKTKIKIGCNKWVHEMREIQEIKWGQQTHQNHKSPEEKSSEAIDQTPCMQQLMSNIFQKRTKPRNHMLLLQKT